MDSLFGFYRNITTLSIGLLGLLIGLRPEKIPLMESKISFMIGISLLVLCILSSIATQYYEVVLLNRETNLYLKKISDILKGNEADAQKLERVKTDGLYSFCQISTITFLVLSLISLLFYVYFSEFIINPPIQ